MNSEEETKALIKRELPNLIQDEEIRGLILQTVADYFASKQETTNRFEQVLEELRRDRLEQSRKWDEQNRKWDENQKSIERMQDHLDQVFQEIRRLGNRHDSTIGALGARWGLYSEQSFRSALEGILADSFGVEVRNITEYDDQGEVFGRPEQIELDLLIKNGLLIICEIKSSMSKADLYIFEKKVQLYQKKHQRQATRKLVISPMVHPAAKAIAPRLGIEVYRYAEDVAI